MCFICHVLTVIIVQTVLVIADTSKYSFLIIRIPKVNQPNIHAHKDLTYRQSKPEVDYDAKDGSDFENIDFLRDINENDFGDDKIVGGAETDINLYPYHVGYGTNCGGVIIDQYWVMTAGHCGYKPYIRYGSKYIHQGKKIKVKANFIHPMWKNDNKDHPYDFDFQLLQLEEPIKMDSNAQPIQLAHIEDMVIGKVVTVTGWGHTKESGSYSKVLQAVRVPIVAKQSCQNVDFPYFKGKLTPRMFCAGFIEGEKDACQGDSGGPATANDRLLGMVSFGYGCATPGAYGVYSKVAKVRAWVKQVTGLKLS